MQQLGQLLRHPLHEFVEACGINLVSELGDKTFILCICEHAVGPVLGRSFKFP